MATSAPSVLLVSIDGFRADYLDLGITPNLTRIARNGVRADWMNPSYPTLTFPNHYSMVTGLRPDRHGIVHNTMRDEQLGDFSLGNRDAIGDARWWGGEPIWVTAQRAGLTTATMFWPGSEAPIDGVRPTRWLPFDEDMPASERVETVLGWLDEPDASRPALATLYFGMVDHAGHAHGPFSSETRTALRTVDKAIGYLLDGLALRGLLDRVNLIVVSDHGMANAPPAQVIALEDMVAPADAEPVTSGQSVGFDPKPGHERAAARQLLGRHAHYRCWRKSDLPQRWHYGQHPRVPPIVCQMEESWSAASRAQLARWSKSSQSPDIQPQGTQPQDTKPQDRMRGAHGYDPRLPSMRAVFIARGPAFRNGVRVPAFDNIDVYPLLARLIGIEPAPHDGDDDAMTVLRPGFPL